MMEPKRPGSGFFQSDIYKELLQSMRSNDENKFNQILTSENIDVNKVIDKGSDYGTLLHMCCNDMGNSKYIATLLNRGANPNLVNSRTKKGPIHQVAIHNDCDSMRVLLEYMDTDPNLLDNFGATALHYACKNNSVDMVYEILKRTDVNLNIINRKGKTPLQLILDKEPSNEYLDVLNALVQQRRIDLTITNSDGITLQQMLEDSYPGVSYDSQVTDIEVGSSLNTNQLFQLLRRNEVQRFLNHVKGNREMLEGNDGSCTILQYCCEYGIDDAVQALLDETVSPNTTCTGNAWTPIMIACRKGYVSIVKMLVNCKTTSFQPINNESVLHCLVNGEYEKQALHESDIERNHLKCLSYIFKKVPRSKLDINYQDQNGNTALHYAAKAGDQNVILEMLNAGAYIGVCNKLNEPACTDITQTTMKTHLDSCIYSNNKVSRDEMYALIFNYDCLVPFRKTEGEIVSNSTDNFIEVPISSYGNERMHKTGETDPLIFISSNSELRPLLTHPIFTSYLHLKWHKIQHYYLINLLFYFLFWLFLTYYILAVFLVSCSNNCKSNSTSPADNMTSTSSHYLLWSLVLLLLCIFILRELLQLIISPVKYITNPENWLEIGIIGVTILVIFCANCNSIKHELSAIAILVSWAELVLLIGKHPSLSTNIEMLKTVSWNFLKFLAWYSILIIAFALCFYSLFKDADEEDNQFQHPGVSIFKTVVMLTGEFDSGSIPFLLYPVTSHILFVLFVFLIAIVLFNLLNGLAVSDTQAIKADAELVGYISQAKLISHVEEKLTNKFNWFGLLPNFNFSDKINMFHEITEGKIKIFPNNSNRVELNDLAFTKNRKHNETDGCCYELKTIYMDPRIVKAAKAILFIREQDKVQESYLTLVGKKEADLREILNEFKICLREYKDINWKINKHLQSSESFD